MSSERVFDHVLILMFENQYRSYVMDNPYMRKLAQQGVELPNAFGVMHPSHTNYIASIAGQLCNITYDYPPAPAIPVGTAPANNPTIVDLVEAKPGMRWKAYMQNYVPMPWTPNIDPTKYPSPFPAPPSYWPESLASISSQPYYPYAYWHNPFGQFEGIIGDRSRYQKIADEAQFWQDLLVDDFPEYAWFSPNIWNDGHYTYGTSSEPDPRAPALVDQLAVWLEGFFKTLRFPGPDSLLPPRTLVVVSFDEADYERSTVPGLKSDYDGPNNVYTVLLGDMIKPGVEREGYNHYSLLRTIEKNFSLGDLGKNDAESNYFQFLWGRHLTWGTAEDTPIEAIPGTVASAGLDDILNVSYVAPGGNTIEVRQWVKGRWGESSSTPLSVSEGGYGVALVACGDQLIAFCHQHDGTIQSATRSPDGTWSGPDTLVSTATGDAFAVTAYRDYGDQLADKVMLCYRTETGIQSLSYSGGNWSAAVDVAHHVTDGEMILGSLGPNVFLMFRKIGTKHELSAISYNTAAFNAVTMPSEEVLKYNGSIANSETSQYQWSPSVYPVSHFWFGPNTTEEIAGNAPDEETARHLRPYQIDAPVSVTTLDGVLHLAYTGRDGQAVQTTLSLSGLLTPENPVSYKNTDTKAGTPTSDGYGTLAESGWSAPEPMAGARCGNQGSLALSRVSEALVLAYQSEDETRVQLLHARYIVSDKGR